MSELKVYHSEYKDQQALTLESDVLRVEVLPGNGAKLASLWYKPCEFELLVQRPGKTYLVEPFDGDYVSGECSGFDDMCPTIDQCYCEDFPWQGTTMADHGEVWSLPWDYAVDEGVVHFAVHGVRFPYKLEKWISLRQESVLHIEYRLTNLSPFDFNFLWAAHMMVNLEEDVELVLPDGVSKIVGTFSISGDFGSYGDEYAWPTATLTDGSRRDLRELSARTAGRAYKYFVKGKMPAGWCGLNYRRSDFSLKLSFPVAEVPYLGVLPNEGGWRDYYNIFLEPCTASFDRPDVARYRGENSVVEGSGACAWHLDIALEQGVGTSLQTVSSNSIEETEQ